MSVRPPIVVGIGAILLGVALWLVVRRGDDDVSKPARTDPTVGSDTLASGGDGNARSSFGVPLQPTLADARAPGAPSLPDTPTPLQQFTGQPRDGDWAAPTEDEIKKRWKQIRGGTLEAVECHQNQCQLTITGSQRDVSQSIADLEGARGLHGFASSLYLSGPEKKPDGTIVLRAYASFER
jgi:hypothetical protein